MNNEIQLVVAIALVKNDQGKILLQRRIDPRIPDANGKWELPGGRINFGESPEDAARRETKEETGCDIRIERLLLQPQSHVWHRTDGKKVHVVVICYEARYVSGTPAALDKKVSEVGWFTKEEIGELDTLRDIKKFVEAV